MNYALNVTYYKDNVESWCIENSYLRGLEEADAISKFDQKVFEMAIKKDLFKSYPEFDYVEITLSKIASAGCGATAELDLIKRKIFNPKTTNFRRVICDIWVDDDTAEELGIGPLDYLEKLLDPVGHIELTQARVLDDDDPQDAAAITHANHIFKEDF